MSKPNDLVTRTLDVNLTAEEIAAYSNALAIEVDNRNALESEAKSSAKRYKESLDEKKDEINILAGKVRAQKEPREVSCKWDFNFNANTKTLIRQDTFDLVETRVIEPSERQAYLQLTEEKPMQTLSEPEHEA